MRSCTHYIYIGTLNAWEEKARRTAPYTHITKTHALRGKNTKAREKEDEPISRMTSTANTRYNSTNEGGGGGGAIAARRRRVKRLNNRFCPRDSVSSTFLVARWRIGIYIRARVHAAHAQQQVVVAAALSRPSLQYTYTYIYMYM